MGMEDGVLRAEESDARQRTCRVVSNIKYMTRRGVVQIWSVEQLMAMEVEKRAMRDDKPAGTRASRCTGGRCASQPQLSSRPGGQKRNGPR